MLNIGILDLQGSVIEHINMINRIGGVNPVRVKNKATLNNIDGLIIPGGESTTIGKLIKIYDIFDTLKELIEKGFPIWGTCAGMVLLAKKIVNENQTHLGVMDISVRRNAYGSQMGSFSTTSFIPTISRNEIPLVFIRAPWIEEVTFDVQILHEYNNKIVAARQRNMMVTSFHPELTDSLVFHEYFINMCLERNPIAN